MSKNIRSVLLILGAFLFSLAGNQNNAYAANQTFSGITISPANQQITLSPDETEHPVDIKISNNLPTAQTLFLSTQDFNALDDTGGLFFQGSNPIILTDKYHLSAWLKLPQTSVTIQPKQTVNVTAVILNQANLEPGGHYGAVMISLNPNANNTANTMNSVSTQPIASSLLFVNKVGGDLHRLKLTEATDNHNIFSLPTQLKLNIKNDGNTHLTPRGIATLTDSKNDRVSSGVINQESLMILPELSRNYLVPLTKQKTSLLPGRYKLLVAYRFDGYTDYKFYQKSFFVVPLGFLLILVGILVTGYLVFKHKFASKIRHVSSRLKS